jgi:integral membrane protein (TIGR01906 family)
VVDAVSATTDAVRSRRAWNVAGAALVAALVPVVLVANGVQVIAHDWFVRFEYGRDGFPADPYGFSASERTKLALTGLHSVQPTNGEGIELLRRARLPNGEPAFDRRELSHMLDVRRLLQGLYATHLIVLAAIAVLAFLARATTVRGLRWGALATLALGVATVVIAVFDFDAYLTGFHGIFFEGDTWRFAEEDTLRRLYPDRFWEDTATLLTVGAIAQAALLLGAERILARRQAKASEARTV